MFWCVLYYLGAFGTLWLPNKTRSKTSQSGVKVRAMKSCQNFLQQTTRSNHWSLTSSFGAFRTIWVHSGEFGCFQHSMQNGPTWCKSPYHEVTSEFFVTNTLHPPHWTLNSCFGVFCTIWLHLGPFGCRTKLSAKHAELVQKFVPRSRILIFHNKHIRLAPLGPKLMFLCISYYLGAFGTVWLPYKTRCKTGRSGASACAMKSCQIRNEHAQSTPLDPKHMFHSVSYYFGAFGTVRLRYKTQCKMGQIDAKVRNTKSRRNFL